MLAPFCPRPREQHLCGLHQGPADQFRRKYDKCRGPLNTAPSPQGRPAFVQAGGSPRGRQFAAQTADSSLRRRPAFAEQGLSRRCARAGCRLRPRSRRDQGAVRGPPVLGETDAAAQANFERSARRPASRKGAVEHQQHHGHRFLEIRPRISELPPLTTNGEQGSLDAFAQWGSGRHCASCDGAGLARPRRHGRNADRVANRMGEIMDEVGG